MSKSTVTRGRPSYTMRLGMAERLVIEAAAAQEEEPLSSYIRRVSLERARRDLAPLDGAADTETKNAGASAS